MEILVKENMASHDKVNTPGEEERKNLLRPWNK